MGETVETRALDALKNVFGHASYRTDLQKQAVETVAKSKKAVADCQHYTSGLR